MNLSGEIKLGIKRNREEPIPNTFENSPHLIEEKKDANFDESSHFYENIEFEKKFFTGFWTAEIEKNYFKFPFRLSGSIKEQRTQKLINVLLDYTYRESCFFLFIQLDSEYPIERTDKNTVELSTKSNCFIVNPNRNSINSNSFGYNIDIEVNIIGFNNYNVNLTLLENEGKWIKIPFSTELVNSIDNEYGYKKYKIIVDLSISKERMNSNENIPYCGIVNEGSTCYMNSLLQMLFMLGEFKRNILNINIPKSVDYRKSKIFSMQKLFYDMMRSGENSHKAVQANSLLNSFGWNKEQLQKQQDVQEFFIVLSDIMEKEIVKSNKENIFKKLFEGKVLTKINCINVPYSSSKEEKFTDIQLPVKNCKNIYESLNKYTQEELLNGNNKYQTDKYGKQEAKKKSLFTEVPKVLIIQLNRFSYNSKSNEMEKINDRFEFYNKIDLGGYTIANEVDCKYKCFGVIVHLGRIDSGHYYSYIKPNPLSKEWYKFNDEKVSLVEKYEVFENNFGGELVSYKKDINNGNITKDVCKTNRSSYLLLYIKRSCIKEVMQQFTLTQIPKEIVERFRYDEKQRAREENINFRKENYININIITREVLERNTGMGIIDNYNANNNNKRCEPLKLNAHKDISIANIVDVISFVTGIDRVNIFIYKFLMDKRFSYINRFNYTMKYITYNLYKKKVSELFQLNEGNKRDEMFLYIHCDTKEKILKINEEENKIISDNEEEYEEKYEYKTDSNNSDRDGIINLNDNELGEKNNKQKQNNIIYFDPRKNKWRLNTGVKSYQRNFAWDIMKNNTNFNIIKNKIYILIIVKYPNVIIDKKRSNNYDLELRLLDIYQIESFETLSSILTKQTLKDDIKKKINVPFLKKIEKYYNDSKIQYLVEYSSLQNFFDPSNYSLLEPFKTNFTIKNNQDLEIYKNSALCIIIDFLFENNFSLNSHTSFHSFRELIESYFKNFFMSISSSFVYYKNDINLNAINRIPLSTLSLESKIPEIKKRIIQLIKDKCIWRIFSKGEKFYKKMKYYFYEGKPNAKYKKSEIADLFSDSNNKDLQDVIELVRYEIDSENTKLNDSYPLINYINTSKSNQIEFNINLSKIAQIPYSIEQKIIIEEVILCDVYSNPFVKVFIPLYEGEYLLSKLSQMINQYIIEVNGEFNFYPEKNLKFFLLLYNPITFVAYNLYDSLDKKYINLNQFKNFQREWRYQPYEDNYELLETENKVFICIYEKNTPVSFPYVLYLNKEQTSVGNFKRKVILHMMKNNYLKEKYGIKERDAENYKEKFRFYRCYLSKNFEPEKLEYMNPQTDANWLKMYGRNDIAFNVKVEIISGNDQDVDLKNSLGIVND